MNVEKKIDEFIENAEKAFSNSPSIIEVHEDKDGKTVKIFGFYYRPTTANIERIIEESRDHFGEEAIYFSGEKGSVWITERGSIVWPNFVPLYKKISKNIDKPIYISGNAFDGTARGIIVPDYRIRIYRTNLMFPKALTHSVAKIYAIMFNQNIEKELIEATMNQPGDIIEVRIWGNKVEPFWKKVPAREIFPALENPEVIFNDEYAYIGMEGDKCYLCLNGKKTRVSKKNGTMIFSDENGKVVGIIKNGEYSHNIGDEKHLKEKISMNEDAVEKVRKILGVKLEFEFAHFIGSDTHGYLYPDGEIEFQTKNRNIMKKFGVDADEARIKTSLDGKVIQLIANNVKSTNVDEVNEIIGSGADEVVWDNEEGEWLVTKGDKVFGYDPVEKTIVEYED